MLRDAYI